MICNGLGFGAVKPVVVMGLSPINGMAALTWYLKGTA